MNQKDKDRLEDILEAIAQIERYTAPGRTAFDHNELVRVWVIYHIQIIGEAAAHLSEDLRQRYSHVPWPQIIAMRNFLIHGYAHIDDDAVWAVVERNLSALKRDVEEILEE